MNEKFIYPLLAILLAVISTNVSAVVPTPPDQLTDNYLQFDWQGTIPLINPDFDWEFVDILGNPYIPKGPAFFTPTEDPLNKNMIILGDPISVFIAPKNITANIINEISASLMKLPTATGVLDPKRITNATDITAIKPNQVAIIINNKLMKNDSTSITRLGDNLSRFELSIILEALIPETNYIRGNLITFSAPVMFSVGITKKPEAL